MKSLLVICALLAASLEPADAAAVTVPANVFGAMDVTRGETGFTQGTILVAPGDDVIIGWNFPTAATCVMTGALSGTYSPINNFLHVVLQPGTFVYNLACSAQGVAINRSLAIVVSGVDLNPTISVNFPFTTLTGGSQVTFSWTGSHLASVSILFSSNGGATDTALVTMSGNTGSFQWTVPQISTAQARIRLVATGLNGATAIADSPMFSILPGNPGAPQFDARGVASIADTSIFGLLNPGSLAAIIGTSLAASTAGTPYGTPWPASLAGTQVLIAGLPAPLLWVSPTQVNFQVPAVASSTATVQVISNGVASAILTLPVVAQLPALYLSRDPGTGQAQPYVFNAANGAEIYSTQPLVVARSQTIILYGTGFGHSMCILGIGQAAPSSCTLAGRPLFQLDSVVQLDSAISFAGLAPGLVGVDQFNLRLPANLPPGRHNAALVMGGTAVPFVVYTN